MVVIVVVVVVVLDRRRWNWTQIARLSSTVRPGPDTSLSDLQRKGKENQLIDLIMCGPMVINLQTLIVFIQTH